jgi:phage gp16-like protein
LDKLTGREWLFFLLIQSCKSNELRKKILNLPDNKITLENVLALARKYKSTEVACKEKDTINNILMKKEKKGGKATPSQPVQQPNATQSSTNANAKRFGVKQSGKCGYCDNPRQSAEHLFTECTYSQRLFACFERSTN